MSVRSEREILEAAIAADFDDLTAHAAYADVLAEEGDPRGEYIQLRLALEDENQSLRLLQDWRERASRLYQRYERDWLGPLAPFLLGRTRPTVEPVAPNIEFTFRRGWLAELHVQDVRDAFTTVLARAPQARMLQALTLRNTRLPNNHGPLEPLIASPHLGTLKQFALGDPKAFGCTADGRLAIPLIRKMQQLRKLDLWATNVDAMELFSLKLPELRSLSGDFLAFLPLRTLADNRSLSNLERLFLWSRDVAVITEPASETPSPPEPASFARSDLRPFLTAPQFHRLTDLALRSEAISDAGCEEIARSGILRRLRRLDLRRCDISDAGANALARSPDLRKLQALDVGANRLTQLGVSQLQEADIPVQWDSQGGDYLDPGPGDDVIV